MNYIFISLIIFFTLQGCSNSTTNKSSTFEAECNISDNNTTSVCTKMNSNKLSSVEKQSAIGEFFLFSDDLRKRDCVKAKYWFEKAAMQKNKTALDGLGIIYFTGCGVEKNYIKAEEYFMLADAEGSSQAKINIGEIYREGGYGISQDYNKAEKFYKLGLIDNPYRANNSLASLFIQQKNYQKAYPYLKKAAELENPEAQYNLGILYYEGIVVQKDYQKAKFWFEKSKQKGWQNSEYYLNNIDSIEHSKL